MDQQHRIRLRHPISLDLLCDVRAITSRANLRNVVRTLYRYGIREEAAYSAWVISGFNLKRRSFSLTEVRQGHQALQRQLERNNPNAFLSTNSEIIVRKTLEKLSSLEVLKSLWIGNGCIDLFIPGISGAPGQRPRLRGLAIEINGPIHHFEPKMNRDEFKSNYLRDLGIGLTTIENGDILNSQTVNYLKSLSAAPRLDSRARFRLWRDIYIETLVHHGSAQEISECLQIPLHLVSELEGK